MAWSFLKRWLGLAAKAAVTVGLIWLLMRGFDTDEAARRLAEIPLWAPPAALGLLAAMVLLATWRWVVIMRLLGDPLPSRTALRLVCEGLFFNQTLPSTIGGDGMRMYRAARLGLPAAAAINGVILDRLAGLCSLLLLVALALPLLIERVAEPLLRGGLFVLVTLGVLGMAMLLGLGWLPHALRRWAPVAWAVGLSDAARQMLRDPQTALPVLALSLIIHGLIVLVMYLFAHALALPAGLVDCFAFVPLVMLLSAVPISIAGWGLREGAMVTAFGFIGVSQSGSLTLSILFGLAMLIAGLPGGALWLTNPDRRPQAPTAPERLGGVPAG